MDVSHSQIGRRVFRDEIGLKVQKRFQDFLEEYLDDNDAVKYLHEAKELIHAERNTVHVSFLDTEKYDSSLAAGIQLQYYRVYPYLSQALLNFAHDRGAVPKNKEVHVAFLDVPVRNKLRELTMNKTGSLVRVSGQVVRTHPVHPELVSGTFLCLACQAEVKDIHQQFKYTQPSVCCTPQCANRRSFSLVLEKSKFVDFQKVRVQETQQVSWSGIMIYYPVLMAECRSCRAGVFRALWR